jgi:hypothetical protein
MTCTATKCSVAEPKRHLTELLLNVSAHNVGVTKRKHHITITNCTVTFLRSVTFTFWNYYVLKLLPFTTITFSDAILSDINVVLC